MPRRIPTYKPPRYRSPTIQADRPRSEESKTHQRRLNDRRWRRFARSFLIEHPLCEECQAEGRLEAATEVHHRISGRERPDLFWDWDNLQALCKSCHSRHTARGE